MKTEPTYLVNIYWTQREVQTVYVAAANESQAKMKAVSIHCKSIDELYDHGKTRAVMFNKQ